MNNNLSIIIPIRDRDLQLMSLIDQLHEILTYQKFDFKFCIFEQANCSIAFNKGKLINSAVSELEKSSDLEHLLINDVDIYPKSLDSIMFECTSDVHHYYGFTHCLGGFFTIEYSLFKRANGFSNDFWGWGWEDVDFQNRILAIGGTIDRSQFTKRGVTDKVVDTMDPDGHKKSNKSNKRLAIGKNQMYTKDINILQTDGLSNCEYTIVDKILIPGFSRIEKVLVDFNLS